MTLTQSFMEQRLLDNGWVEVEGEWKSPWTGNVYSVDNALRIQSAVEGEDEE